MASAKFLEEALSTDVDESAVNAIVGSLETQLVTTTPTVSSQQGPLATVNQNHMNSAISNGGTVSTQKHGVANGGPGSINIILNSDNNKPTATSALQSSNVVHSSVVNTVVPSLHGGVPASGYINQVTSSASQTGISNVSKSHESVKIVYPSGSQSINNRVSFQPGALPNGNLGLATLQSHAVLNAAVTSSVQSVVSQTHSQSGSTNNKQISVDHSKTQGTTLVIKASANPSVSQGSSLSGSVGSVPVSVNSTMTLTGTYVNTAVGTTATTGMSGMVTIAKPVIPAGVTPGTTIIPANVQLVNVRAGTPGLQTPKNLSSRVVIGQPHMVGGRPGQPGQITLLQPGGLQPGTQGHLLLKTENGQYQLLRVGPAPTNSATAAAAVAPTTVSITTNSIPSGAYRIQPVPPHGTVTVATTTAAATASIQASQQPATLNTSQNPAVQRVVTISEASRGILAVTTKTYYWITYLPKLKGAAGSPGTSKKTKKKKKKKKKKKRRMIGIKLYLMQSRRHPVDTTKEKCRKFLANLLELSSREPKAVERNVRTLIQELIDTKVEPEEFCDRLERLLNASPQPCLIGFLKKSLPLLRQSLVTKELVIDGIRPPPHTVVYSLPNSSVPQLQTQLRPQAATAQVRLMAPVNTANQNVGVTTIPRQGQALQSHRLVAPVRPQTPGARMMSNATLRPQSPITTSSPALSSPSPSPIRTSNPSLPAPPLHIKQTSQTTTKANAAMLKSPTLVYPKTALVSHTKTTIATKPTTPSLLPKPASKEKEKKSFSSAGYAGDDDINDVAAMGGVNLAEETQRILGSTEFVGTQIRSCKDEVFLHMAPLQHKIRQIVSKHGLDEPPPEVATLISHACQERLKTLLQKLSVIGEHRIDVIKMDPRFEVQHDIKGQLKFLEELDRVERKRHDEHERELLLRAAKSRSKSEDPEQAKLKAKAKEMQRAEMEELRQREANLTALQAIGPRKKPRLELAGSDSIAMQCGVGSSSGTSNNISRTQLPIRPRVKRINLRDLLFLLEQEKETCGSSLLYRSYLK